MFLRRFEFVEPVKIYSALREEDYPFLLESATKHEKRARFSYIGANPEFVVEISGKGTKVDGAKFSGETNPFKALKEISKFEKAEGKFVGGFVGYIAYDAVQNYLGGEVRERSEFGFYKEIFIVDHVNKQTYFLSLNSAELNPERIIEKAKRSEIREKKENSNILGCDADKDDFIEMVSKAKDYIYEGEIFQVVLSREYRVSSDLSPLQIYLNLRRINPSPYMFLLEFEKSLVGASPETMASVENNILKINPIAGTAGRGRDEEEDSKIAKSLLSDEKERAEHVMLVDLARNDVRKVCKAGSVKVAKFMEVIKYSHVQHIESEVVGELREDVSCFEAMEAAFPAGTLTGAPKVRAMEIIDELEKSKRRVYGGCVGYFSVNNSADMAIAIRMVEIDDAYRIRAGAGIVADSNPEREFYETEKKMRAVLKALEVVE